MEKKLLDAAMEGNIAMLKDLIQPDPLVLDRSIVSCVSVTPLHIASMLGHLGFVKELVSHKPELATELNSRGSTPLHLAAAKGRAETVKELALVDRTACMVRNEDGRMALHVAAVKGRVKVLGELARVRTNSTRALTDRGETVLHVCVGHNGLVGLKALADAFGKDDEFLNWKDFDGWKHHFAYCGGQEAN